MAQAIQLQQNKSNQQSFIITTVAMTALLLILFFITLSHPIVEDAIDGVMIDFGQTDDGLGDDNLREAGGQSSSPAEAVSNPEPTPPTPTKAVTSPVSTPRNNTVVSEDPQAVAIAKMQKEEKIRQQKALLEQQRIAEAVAKAEKERLAQLAQAQAAKDQVANAWTKGKNTKGQGGGQGNANGDGPGGGQGNTKPGGNQGNPNGVPGGDPNGKGTTYDLKGRTWRQKPLVFDNTQKTGNVVVAIKVDKGGNVVYAKYQQKGSNTTDQYLIQLAEQSALKSKFSADLGADDEQFGTITFKFSVQ